MYVCVASVHLLERANEFASGLFELLHEVIHQLHHYCLLVTHAFQRFLGKVEEISSNRSGELGGLWPVVLLTEKCRERGRKKAERTV